MKEAKFYTKKEKNAVECHLCPHHCLLNPGNLGLCHVRKNENEKLYSLSYGNLVAKNPDPIEKKPLFHFYPGSLSYSIATAGCNLHCKHCQNADISQAKPEEIFSKYTEPEDIIQDAIRTGCSSIAYTYTEPTIYYEYAYDIAKLAHKNGLKNVFVTNGYIEKEPLEEITPYLDAANIDLKSMNEEFYKKICGAHLQPVLDRIQDYHDLGIWIELTTLLIPGYNDSKKELNDISRFIAGIDPEIPWHVTGFHPTYKLTDARTTTASDLEQAAKIGMDQGLQYVYQGNLGSGEDTICPSCGRTLIKRNIFQVSFNMIKNSACPHCETLIKGIGMG